MRRFLAALVLLGALVIVPVAAVPPAHAATGIPSHAMVWGGSQAGNAALNWAERNAAGHWYLWGGTGPSYDCSGLVMEAVGHATGIWLPHSTYAMLGNRHLHRIPVSSAQRGDLLFYGSGHVEVATAWWHVSFGAQQAGTRVGWHEWNGWWAPSMAFRVW